MKEESSVAKFDRKILLPYLRDVYSVELLVLKRQKEYQELCSLLNQYEEALQNHREPEEVSVSVRGVVGWCIAAGVLCLLAIVSAMLIRYSESFLYLSLLLLPVEAICIAVLLRQIAQYRKDSARYQEYRKKMRQYQSEEHTRELLREQAAEYRKQIAVFVDQSNVLGSIRHSLYSANVIPAQFRTLSAVRYLFHYFQSSKADDVDVVLQIFSVETLRQNPKPISQKESDQILHQRVLLANQVMGDAVQREYVETQMMEIANRGENVEFRIQYLKMINANQDVSNYFFQQAIEA